jgi:hypothetical protein
MASVDFDLAELISRLERDVARTVGDAHRELVHETAARIQEFDIADAHAKIVDDVQQALHDEFVDTTWPACPRHHRHPLWYRDGAWWCEQDAVAIAPLGELPIAITGA